MADPLIILDCMVFWFYPWFHAPVLMIVMGFALAGAAVQLFLLRRTGKARWFPRCKAIPFSARSAGAGCGALGNSP